MAVSYVIYKEEDSYILYVGNNEIQNDVVDMYKFKDVGDPEISNYPNITALSGVYNDKEYSKKWMTYYKGVMAGNLKLYDKGELEVIEETDKYKLVEFSGEKLSGKWYIRKSEISERSVLLWKPMIMNEDGKGNNEKFTCPKKCKIKDYDKEDMREKFTSAIKMGDTEFEGTALASGIHRSPKGRTYLFPDEFIEKMVDKYRDKPNDIKVDWNHDENHVGQISKIELIREPIPRLYVAGDAGREVMDGSALSVDFDVKAKWDDKFKVYKAYDADIISVTVAPGEEPVCKICYVDKNGGRFN